MEKKTFVLNSVVEIGDDFLDWVRRLVESEVERKLAEMGVKKPAQKASKTTTVSVVGIVHVDNGNSLSMCGAKTDLPLVTKDRKAVGPHAWYYYYGGAKCHVHFSSVCEACRASFMGKSRYASVQWGRKRAKERAIAKRLVAGKVGHFCIANLAGKSECGIEGSELISSGNGNGKPLCYREGKSFVPVPGRKICPQCLNKWLSKLPLDELERYRAIIAQRK